MDIIDIWIDDYEDINYLEKILSYYNPEVNIHQWLFQHDEYGKPYIINNLSKKLYFNISHSQKTTCIAVSTSLDIGIDIEYISQDEHKETYDIMFTKEEQNYLTKNPKKFYTLWTLKEAYLKAHGLGFSMNPLEVDFSPILNTLTNKKEVYTRECYLYSTMYKGYKLACVALNYTRQVAINYKHINEQCTSSQTYKSDCT